MRIKICGLTRTEDAALAYHLGATELGMIFAPSPRRLTLSDGRALRSTLPPEARFIGVFVNERKENLVAAVKELSLAGLQLHGNETPADIEYLREKIPDLFIMKTILVKDGCLLQNPKDYGICDTLIFDSAVSHFTPEKRAPLSETLPATSNFYLAGGINPANVLELTGKHRPTGIDVSSGVEVAAGMKDENLLKELFRKVKDLK